MEKSVFEVYQDASVNSDWTKKLKNVIKQKFIF